MANTLSADATFNDLRLPPRLAERFVRKVLGVMRAAQKSHGQIKVRMGTTGTGVAPNYRFEETDGRPLVAIDGANHQPWPDGASFGGSENWSKLTMSYGEVEEVLRALTGYKAAGAKQSSQAGA